MDTTSLSASELYLGPEPARHVPDVVTPNKKALTRARSIFLITVAVPFFGAVTAMSLIGRLPPSRTDLVLTAVLYVVTLTGIEVGYHRLFSHHAFRARPGLRAMLAILGAMAAQGPVSYWVAHHRRHHQHSDKPGDPHSPQLSGEDFIGRMGGLWHAHIGWIFGSKRASPGRYARDILNDRSLMRIDRLYFVWLAAGALLPASIGLLSSGHLEGALTGFLWGGLLRIFLVQHIIYGVNSICHVWGTQPFQSGDSSRNSAALMIISLGTSLHNAHHAFPSTAKNSVRWWEVDLCWGIIRVFSILGLATEIRVPSEHAIAINNRSGATNQPIHD